MIPIEDLTEQKRIYKYKGEGDWRIIAYCSEASIIMENICNRTRQNFGVSGLTATEGFEPVEGLEWDRERQAVIETKADPFQKAWNEWRVGYERSCEVIRVTDGQARHFFNAGRESVLTKP
jgi:hypothetical protein